MTERDGFELDLADALRAYAEEATTQVHSTELARHFATAYPHGRTTIRGSVRLAWPLLLLAGLLTAMVGGLLIAGSQQKPTLKTVVPPRFVCPTGSTPDEPGPVDQARPAGLTLAVPPLAFDRGAGRLVTLTGPEDDDTWTSVETWTFDVCTNSWTQMHPDQEPPPGTGQLVYDVDSDLTLASDGIGMWAYDLETDTWTEKGPFAPFADQGFPSLRFYDPVSGLVIALGDDGDDDTLGLELWGYEVETDTWTPISQLEPLTIGAHGEDFAYDASVDRLVAYSYTWESSETGAPLIEPETWLFDLRSGIWSGMEAITPEYDYGMWGIQPAISYDEAAERTVVVGQGHSAAYDATADHWETLWVAPSEERSTCGTRPECRMVHMMVYDAVNERLVAYGGSLYTAADGWVETDDLLAFDMESREWTVLLEQSDG